jgi:putative glutamine amidotransferase
MAGRPVVGISFAPEARGYGEKEEKYLAALRAAGADPLPVRPGREAEVPDLLRRARGWVFSGGDDISPEYYGEKPHPRLKEVVPERDRMDLLVARAVLAEGHPVLGICLGVQLLNVAAGGTLVQDIPSQVEGAIPHADGARHRVRIEPGTRLAEIAGEGEVEVNSYHHQALGRLGRGFRATARSADGVLEAIERPGDPFVLGVQWHPEREGCAPGAAEGLFRAFVRAAAEWIPGKRPGGP